MIVFDGRVQAEASLVSDALLSVEIKVEVAIDNLNLRMRGCQIGSAARAVHVIVHS
jgi:hypothetical protein